MLLAFTLNHHDNRNVQARLAGIDTALASARRLEAKLRSLQQPPQARLQEIIELEARLKVLKAA